MRPIIIITIIALLGQALAAEDSTSISKDHLIESYQEFKKGSNFLMQGITALRENNNFSSKKSEAELIKERNLLFHKAKPHFEKSILLNPYYAPAYESLALILREAENQLDAAIQNFTKAIELDPSQESSIEARGELNVILNRLVEARKDLAILEQLKSHRSKYLRLKIEKQEKANKTPQINR